jgi:hypothetical protein
MVYEFQVQLCISHERDRRPTELAQEAARKLFEEGLKTLVFSSGGLSLWVSAVHPCPCVAGVKGSDVNRAEYLAKLNEIPQIRIRYHWSYVIPCEAVLDNLKKRNNVEVYDSKFFTWVENGHTYNVVVYSEDGLIPDDWTEEKAKAIFFEDIFRPHSLGV